MSHRGKEFTQVINEAEADLRTLLAVPENYRVLFLQVRHNPKRIVRHCSTSGYLLPLLSG